MADGWGVAMVLQPAGGTRINIDDDFLFVMRVKVGINFDTYSPPGSVTLSQLAFLAVTIGGVTFEVVGDGPGGFFRIINNGPGGGNMTNVLPAGFWDDLHATEVPWAYVVAERVGTNLNMRVYAAIDADPGPILTVSAATPSFLTTDGLDIGFSTQDDSGGAISTEVFIDSIVINGVVFDSFDGRGFPPTDSANAWGSTSTGIGPWVTGGNGPDARFGVDDGAAYVRVDPFGGNSTVTAYIEWDAPGGTGGDGGELGPVSTGRGR